MSFEVFLQCFDRGGPAGVSRSAVRRLFPVVEAKSESDYWRVCYDDLNTCNIHVTPLASDPTRLESLSVHRPCGGGLWEAILAVMRLGSVALYFPGDAPPLVANQAAGEDLPADMVAGMGQPRVVHSPDEILEVIKHA